ncbi:MAG TPA: hypothetical protein VF063_10730 [Gaiellaceae bacterium]
MEEEVEEFGELDLGFDRNEHVVHPNPDRLVLNLRRDPLHRDELILLGEKRPVVGVQRLEIRRRVVQDCPNLLQKSDDLRKADALGEEGRRAECWLQIVLNEQHELLSDLGLRNALRRLDRPRFLDEFLENSNVGVRLEDLIQELATPPARLVVLSDREEEACHRVRDGNLLSSASV